jgi:hypothetical protein
VMMAAGTSPGCAPAEGAWRRSMCALWCSAATMPATCLGSRAIRTFRAEHRQGAECGRRPTAPRVMPDALPRRSWRADPLVREGLLVVPARARHVVTRNACQRDDDSLVDCSDSVAALLHNFVIAARAGPVAHDAEPRPATATTPTARSRSRRCPSTSSYRFVEARQVTERAGHLHE